MKGVKFTFHPSTGLEPKTFDFYFEDFPMIVGMTGNLPSRFHRDSVIEIVGPEFPPTVMESMVRTFNIQRYEYMLLHDQKAADFGRYLEMMENGEIDPNAPINTTKQDHSTNDTNYHG